MDNIRFHQSLPENDRDYGASTDRAKGFTEMNTADFVLTADSNRAMELGSVRVEFDLVVNKDGATAVGADRINIDNHVGAHALFDNVNVILSSQGQIESIDSYGRFVKMINSSTSSEDDNHKAVALCELRSPNIRHTEYLIKPQLTKTSDSTATINPDCSVKLMCCLNRPSSGNFLDFSKVGSVRLQLKLARNVAVFSGADCGTAGNPAPNYVLKNLRCVFRSVPAQGQPVQLQRVLAMNQALESANASISMAVPAVVNAVSGTFLTQARENSYNFNNYKLERPDNITSLQMNYNDTTNAYQTFSLRNHQEILHNYLESMRGAGINDSKLSKINANDCYGIGIDFKENIDFSTGNKFSMTISSGIDSLNPVILFLYFHSLVSM